MENLRQLRVGVLEAPASHTDQAGGRRLPFRAMSLRTRSAARDITSRGGRFFPSARQTATVLLRRAAIFPQHLHALMCFSTALRRAGAMSPSR
jgi:hypothetical protein